MSISDVRHQWLVRVDPRPKTAYASQGRAVLATDLDGIIYDHPGHGLFVHETRLLSHYCYRVNGEAPAPIASSNVEQHSWLGYFGVVPPGLQWREDTGSGKVQPVSEETIELMISRTISGDEQHAGAPDGLILIPTTSLGRINFAHASRADLSPVNSFIARSSIRPTMGCETRLRTMALSSRTSTTRPGSGSPGSARWIRC